ncbi:MAG: polysaccharide biosynthesis C-terminal domain-containing protein [Paludibacteraceae bacterium]|nr:polysaccharide biosynthesis C-terminal domain-containing protein [Paludibacteraceae bacterium]
MVVLYLSVKYFGTTFQRDSWVLSIAFWGIVICLIYSPINDIFRTKYIFIKSREGEEAAIRSVNSLMNLFNLSYLVVALAVFVFATPISTLLAPGFDDEMRRYLYIMIFSLIPFFILQQHSNILIALLNTYESYFYPEIVFLLASIINILAIVFFSDTLGIYSLVVATTLNNVIMVLVLTCMLKRKVRSFRPISMEGIKWAKPFVKLSLPMYLGALCSQVYLFVEKSLCTHFGEGAVSVFDYARQIANMPYVVFSSIVPIVMTPLLSMAFVKGDEVTFSNEMRRLAHLFLYLTCFFVILMSVDAEQVSYILFSCKHETFMKILGYLCAGVFFMTVTLICGQALIARDRVTDYVIAVISGNIISILLCYVWVNISVHLENVALSFLSGQIISSLIALYKLRIKGRKLFLKSLFFMFLACLAAYGLTYSFQYLMRGTVLLSMDKLYVVMDMLICSIIIFFILLCMLIAFDAEERKTIYDMYRRFVHKWFKHK